MFEGHPGRIKVQVYTRLHSTVQSPVVHAKWYTQPFGSTPRVILAHTSIYDEWVGELYFSVEWALATTASHFPRIIHCVSLVLLGDSAFSASQMPVHCYCRFCII